jgi:hypothetical protein
MDDSLKKRCKLELDDTTNYEDLNLAFGNHREEDALYLLTTIEIAEAQKRDQRSTTSKMLKHQKRIFVLNLLKT